MLALGDLTTSDKQKRTMISIIRDVEVIFRKRVYAVADSGAKETTLTLKYHEAYTLYLFIQSWEPNGFGVYDSLAREFYVRLGKEVL